MNIFKESRFWRGMAAVFVSLFVLALNVSQFAIADETDLNSYLNINATKVVESGGAEVDTEHYKKKTSSIDEQVAQKLDLIEKIVDEGIVLVKNKDNTLPLADREKVTLLGRASVDLVYGGASGAGVIGNEGIDEINYTLKQGLENSGFSVNPKMWDFYKSKTGAEEGQYSRDYTSGNNTTGEVPVSEYPADNDWASYGEASIVVIARNAGEGRDASYGAFADGYGYYNLQARELEVVAKAKEISDTVIVIINSPSPLSIDELEKDAGIDAILVVGGVGARGADSIGKVLKGIVNPSGHLNDIYAADSHSSAAVQNAGNYVFANAEEITGRSPNGPTEGNTYYVVQAEGIYIGYRYYETRYEDCVLGQSGADSAVGVYKSTGGGWSYPDEVTYSFGYGQSYTTFEQELLALDVSDSVVTATVNVKNTGTVPGKDVVQLYVQSPYTEYDIQNKVEKSAVQLVSFGKTEELAPGEDETLTIKMDLYTICSYDYINEETWILEDGTYHFAIGNDAHDALNNILAKKGKTTSDGMDYDGNSEKTEEWVNDSFLRYNEPTFDEDGFTTYEGTYHEETGIQVENQLETADLNYWIEDAVEYLTRNDWEGTWPSPYEDLAATEDMVKRLIFEGVYEPGPSDTSSITLGADTGYQLSMMMGSSYDDANWDLILDQMTPEEMLALVAKNFGATEPLPGIAYPGTLDNDGPSGSVAKYETQYDTGSTVFEGIEKYSSIDTRMFPSETVVASTFNQRLAYELGLSFSEDMYYTGLSSIWAPGLDLHRTPYSGRNFEYFSEDSMLSYIMGAQEVAGIQSNGGVAAPKHFAFNDQEDNRYGYCVFINEQAARETSLRAFEGGMAVSGARCTMSVLNRIGLDWAGASDVLQNNILRGEWGFDGYILTDNAMMPFMYGRGVAFGTDKFLLLPMANREEELNVTALKGDLRLLTSMREACKRILYVYVNSKAMNGMSADTQVVITTPWWKTAVIIVDVALALLAALCVTRFVMLRGRNKKKEVR